MCVCVLDSLVCRLDSLPQSDYTLMNNTSPVLTKVHIAVEIHNTKAVVYIYIYMAVCLYVKASLSTRRCLLPDLRQSQRNYPSFFKIEHKAFTASLHSTIAIKKVANATCMVAN